MAVRKAEIMMKQAVIVGIIAGIMALLGFGIWYNGQHNLNVNYNTQTITSIPDNIEEKSIIFNNVTLNDSTTFDGVLNTCSASKLGMNIKIYPCVANALFAHDITQYINFTWTGASPQNTSWVFVYEGSLESGKIYLYQNTSYIYSELLYQDQSVSGTIDQISGFVNLGSPDGRCQIGNIHNSQMYNVTRSINGTTSKVYCFTTASQINATSYLLGGNITQSVLNNSIRYEMRYNDVSNQIHYMGYGLLQDNRSYYSVNSVIFQPGQTIQTKWMFTPNNSLTNVTGKWHILGYDSNTGLINSITSDQYLYVDPWWDLSVPYKRSLNFTTGDALNTNYTHRVRIPFQSEFGADCTNSYVVWRDSYEVDSHIRTCNATTLEIAFRNQNATGSNVFDNNYSLYYGAPIGSRKSDPNVVYLFFDNFTGSTLNLSKYSQPLPGGYNCSVISNGVCTLADPTIGSNRLVLASALKFGTNSSFEGFFTLNGTQNGQRYFGFLPNATETTIPNAGRPFSILGGNVQQSLANDTTQNLTVIFNTSAPHYFTVFRNSTGLAGWQDNDSAFSTASATLGFANTSAMSAGVQLADASGNNITFWRVFGDISSRPAYTLGSQTLISEVGVEQVAPINNFVTPSSMVNISCNVTGKGSTVIANASVYVVNITEGTVFSSTNLTSIGRVQENFSFILTPLSQGNYHWWCEARGNGNEFGMSSNRTFIIDASNPVVNLTIITPYPVTDRFPVNISFFLNGSDPQLQSCFYEFNGVNTTASSCNANINVSANNFGIYTIRGYANDSVGNIGSNSSNASVIYYNVTQSSSTVSEGGSSIFNFTVNMTNIPSISTIFRYNNTLYNPTTQTSSQNGSFSSYLLGIPAGAGNATGILQFWNWTANITGAVNFTTKSYNQTVFGVLLSNCSAGGVLIMNFTHYDEASRLQFNASSGNNLQLDLQLKSLIDSSIVFNFNSTRINNQSLLVCLPSGVLNNTSYRVDLTGSYIGTGAVQEFFYIDNGTLSLTNIPQNYSWFDLNLNDSTTFLFTFLDENGIQVPEVIVHTLRYYVGDGKFIEIETSKEDNNGETHIHLVQEDVIYKFNVSLQGRQLFLSDQYNAKCLSSPCAITLSAQADNELFPTVYNNLPEGSFRVVVNKTSRQITLYFNLNQSELMNLTVISADNNVATVVGNGTTLASAGQITVTVPTGYGNQTYYAVIYKGSNFVATRVVDLSQSPNDYFGSLALFLTALAILCLALIGASHGEWVIVWTVLGLITASTLYLVHLPWYALMTFIAGAGIFLIKLVSRRRVQ